MKTSAVRPVAGSICRATTVGAFPRLVLVVETPHSGDIFDDTGVVTVRLLSNETEMGAEGDSLLPADLDSGRPYDLLVHDFPGYVLAVNLSTPLWVIKPSCALVTDLWLPVMGPQDGRWGWKVEELEGMQALQPSLAFLLGET